jgi:trans-aconitate methyltransferase
MLRKWTMTTLESIARELVPPVVVRLRRAVLSKMRRPVQGAEQNADFYDQAFLRGDHWKKHYTESHYYPVWALLADRVVRANPNSVIDIGCGPGQVAALLRDKGIQRYTGVDFSTARIDQARKVCPEFTFLACDVFASDVLRTGDYDFVVCTEFLEHVDRDLAALDLIRPGTRFLGTVPNFGGEQHVRFFRNRAEVAERYSDRFRDFRVDEHLAHRSGTRYFILEGTKR